MKYEFSIVLKQADVNDEIADKLYESGCDDASLLTSAGVTKLQFDRDAVNLDEALATAVQSVEGLGLTVARVEIERNEVPQPT